MYNDVVEKLYGMDEDIDIKNKKCITFGNKEDLIIFAKINDKKLVNEIKDGNSFCGGESQYILNMQFGSVSNDLNKDLKINFYIKGFEKIRR